MDGFGDAEAALGAGADFGSILGALRMLDPAAAATGSSNAEILQKFNVNEPAAPVPTAAAPSQPKSAADALGLSMEPPAAAAPAAAPVPAEDIKYAWIHQTGIKPKVQNVVSMFNLGTKLDLKYIALHANNAEYNPKRFAAVIMRVRDPKTTALIFESGKVVVTGAENEEASKRGSKRFAKIILKLGFQARFKDFQVQNLVGSCAVPFPLRLEMLAADYSLFSSYEPELFPGLIFRMENPKVVLLIFVSGKIVLTGARNSHQMFQAFENIYPVLRKYSRVDPKEALAK